MLTGKQRAYLRALSNSLHAVIQIGKDGVTESVVDQIIKTLEKRELIKIHVLENSLLSTDEACDKVCQMTCAQPVQRIGMRFVIYKPSSENPQIVLTASEENL